MSDVAVGAPTPEGRPTLLRAASLLAGANLVAILTGLVTGPVVARALGPEGRGLLAAIVVPLAVAAQVGQFSLGEFATRRVARGAPPGTVLGSILPLLLGSGLLATVALLALGDVLSSGSGTVRHYLVVGALLLPVGLVGPAVIGLAVGRHRWGFAAVSQSSGPLAYAVAVVVLALAGALTVQSAAIATIASGLVGLLVVLPAAYRRRTPLRRDPEVTRDGFGYGVRALPGVVAVFSNGRLDQVLMLGLAGPRQLGLYAVAVTYSAMTTSLVAAVGVAITPSVAAGDRGLLARTCRLAMVVTAICAGVAAVASYPMFRVVFGVDFVDAVAMTLVLLLGQVPAAGSLVLGLGLRSMGRPGLVSSIDVAGLALTVPGLFLLVPAIGGLGAALVTLVAATVVFVLLVRAATRATGMPAREFTAIRSADVRTGVLRVRGAVRTAVRRATSRDRSAPADGSQD